MRCADAHRQAGLADAPLVPLVSKKKVTKDEGPINYGPKDVKDGQHVFGVAHIYASFNDTFVVRRLSRGGVRVERARSPFVVAQHVTDLSGKETIIRVTGAGVCENACWGAGSRPRAQAA